MKVKIGTFGVPHEVHAVTPQADGRYTVTWNDMHVTTFEAALVDVVEDEPLDFIPSFKDLEELQRALEGMILEHGSEDIVLVPSMGGLQLWRRA